MRLCNRCSGLLDDDEPGWVHTDAAVCIETLTGLLKLQGNRAESYDAALQAIKKELGLSEDAQVDDVVGVVSALRHRVDVLESAVWRLHLTIKDQDTALCALLKVKP